MEADQILLSSNGLAEWSSYSVEHKVTLTSHAMVHRNDLYLFDPIELADDPFDVLCRQARPRAIVLTNGNHVRASRLFAERLQIPIWAPERSAVDGLQVKTLPTGETEWEGWNLFPLPGGGPGETAFRLQIPSLVVIGDAIVNLEDHGFIVLPEKYCKNQVQLKEGLERLVQDPFEQLAVAHGSFVKEKASDKVRELLS